MTCPCEDRAGKPCPNPATADGGTCAFCAAMCVPTDQDWTPNRTIKAQIPPPRVWRPWPPTAASPT